MAVLPIAGAQIYDSRVTSDQERTADNKVIKSYPINNFITFLFTLTIFAKDLDFISIGEMCLGELQMT